jgi:hypothetical protein
MRCSCTNGGTFPEKSLVLFLVQPTLLARLVSLKVRVGVRLEPVQAGHERNATLAEKKRTMIAYIQETQGRKYLQLKGTWTSDRDDAQAFATCMQAAKVVWTFDLDDVEVVMTFGDSRFDVRTPCRTARAGRAVRSPGGIRTDQIF